MIVPWDQAAGLVLLISLWLAANGCAFPRVPRLCADGAPVKILQDPSCHRGVCGWSCLPARWTEGER